MSKTFSQSIFAIAHTNLRMAPFNNHGRTLRMVVPANVAATALQVRFSNRCGSTVLPVGASSLALCNEAGVLQPDTLVPLTVGGRLSFELQPGEDILSDEATFGIAPGSFFAINIYYPTTERVVSGNWVSIESFRSNKGNYSADLEIAAPSLVSRFARTVIASDITVEGTTVCDVVAHGEKPGKVIACFGDSITQQGNWTGPFTKLLHHRYPGEASLCNLGISGNRLLADSPPVLNDMNGISGIARFDHDVLTISGLTHCIIALGTNDIGLPGSHGLPDSDVPSLEQYTAAMEALANKLHQHGAKAYVATLTPRAITGPFDEGREALRQKMNTWLRSAACFDAVLDFDTVLRRDDGEHGMKEGCHLPDGLHPSPLGGTLLAKSIDLELFA